MVPGTSERIVYDDGTEAWFRRPMQDVFTSLIVGRAGVTFANDVLLRMDACIATSNSLVIFHDWEAMEGYSVDAKKRYVRWIDERPAHPQRVHLLLKNGLLSMAAAVVSIRVGRRIAVYTDRDQFETARSESLFAARIAMAGGGVR